jgi:hypothetical protein
MTPRQPVEAVNFNDQVPIPAQTGGGLGKDEKSHEFCLFSSGKGFFIPLKCRVTRNLRIW